MDFYVAMMILRIENGMEDKIWTIFIATVVPYVLKDWSMTVTLVVSVCQS